MKHIIDVLLYLTIGALVGVGIRIAEWAIPAPKAEVIHKVDDESKCVRKKGSAA
jgi:hypothetical protein